MLVIEGTRHNFMHIAPHPSDFSSFIWPTIFLVVLEIFVVRTGSVLDASFFCERIRLSGQNFMLTGLLPGRLEHHKYCKD